MGQALELWHLRGMYHKWRRSFTKMTWETRQELSELVSRPLVPGHLDLEKRVIKGQAVQGVSCGPNKLKE